MAIAQSMTMAIDRITRRDELALTYHDITHYRARTFDRDRSRRQSRDTGLDLS